MLKLLQVQWNSLANEPHGAFHQGPNSEFLKQTRTFLIASRKPRS